MSAEHQGHVGPVNINNHLSHSLIGWENNRTC